MIEHYTKYDHLFHNVRPRAVEGIKIFTQNDAYLVEQKYEEVTKEERQIWKRLFEKLIQPLDKYACKEYLLGLQALGFSSNVWPDFSKISPVIEEATGWQLTPVAGFLNEFLFFQLNAQRKFPVTDIIRQSKRFEQKYADQHIQNRDEYTPEPDIYHDIRGHCPFLMNDGYGDFLAGIGKLGYTILTLSGGPMNLASSRNRMTPITIAKRPMIWITKSMGLG